MAFGFVVPTLGPVATVFVLRVTPLTAPVVGLVAESVLGLVPIEIPERAVLAGVVDPGVMEVVPVEVNELPVLPVVAVPIELVCPLRFAVVAPWLLVLPTWPMWTSGLTWEWDVPEFVWPSLELVARFDCARDR
jgi:hypothetical protein